MGGVCVGEGVGVGVGVQTLHPHIHIPDAHEKKCKYYYDEQFVATIVNRIHVDRHISEDRHAFEIISRSSSDTVWNLFCYQSCVYMSEETIIIIKKPIYF